ncbi:membrane-associated protein [Halorubrum sp. JWXQ-INN 858]|uniref:DedA family protein n=1 Tax=Halorubrum sp. JWXQ-INN 858 TaxID=2690782 RepID=UPI00135A7CDA|nr:VTT domain-containing protein [Halorubrum sp. JWXQ-INN 858]MWV64131.1 membrane-associated protein [Halorubrum sp. JWXQ-INN 858]
MLPSATGTGVLLQALGVPLILLLFYVDGMIVGKVTPPAALYVAYVALVAPENAVLVAVAAGCVIAATLGQWTIYRGFNEDSPEFVGIRRAVPYVDRIPAVVKRRIGQRRMDVVSGLFDRFGGAGIAVTNAVPGIRSLMAVPAGLSGYPRWRFLAFATVGNVGYLVLLTAIARGAVTVVGFAPGG